MMLKAAQFLQDNKGYFSSIRLAFLLWILGTLVAWMWISIDKGEIQPIDDTVLTIIAILMTGKVVQKFPEGSAERGGESGSAAPAAPTAGSGTSG